MCFMESAYMSCSDSFGSQNEVDIHRDLWLDLYYVQFPWAKSQATHTISWP